MSKKNGRPSLYTQEIADEVCDRLMAGESLRQICSDEHLPNAATVHRWVVEDREGFCNQYARARQAQAVQWAEEILEMADDKNSDTQRSRLQVDTRKWLLSKVLPKVYGDKLMVGGDQENPLNVAVMRMTDEELIQRATQVANRLTAVKGNGSDG